MCEWLFDLYGSKFVFSLDKKAKAGNEELKKAVKDGASFYVYPQERYHWVDEKETRIGFSGEWDYKVFPKEKIHGYSRKKKIMEIL